LRHIELDPERPLTSRDVDAIANHSARVTLGAHAREAMARSHALLDRLIADRARIYGVTTGYGPLATSHVSPARLELLQKNLVYHLATGVGEPLSRTQSRAVLLARLASLARGYSALSPERAEILLQVLNANLAPWIPSLGTVGASGDLTPLAHAALALMGEGAFLDENHQKVDAAQVLAAHQIAPLELRDREGLALVNGTSVMTAIGALNDVALERLIAQSARGAVAYAELLEGRLEAWDPRHGIARPHPGQQWAHARLAQLARGSERLVPLERETLAAIDPDDGEGVLPAQPLLQDVYSIRCAPQALGAARDVLAFHRQTIERELDATSDNPIFYAEDDLALHGGNFFGQHVSFASDALLNAVIQLMVWAERRIARLTDATRSGFPPFLQARGVGLRSGFMGAQVTASALVAHARAHASPASIQSMPTNGDNQDITTMGTIAAWRASRIIERAWDVLAIEQLILAQGIDLVRQQNDRRAFSASSNKLHEDVREHAPFLDEDRPLSDEIALLSRVLAQAPVEDS